MIKCEGYKAFHGTATIRPLNPAFPARDVTGDWLYKPDCNCWYCQGSSFPAEIVTDIREESEAADLVSELKRRLNALQDLVTHGQNIKEIDELVAATRAWLAGIE